MKRKSAKPLSEAQLAALLAVNAHIDQFRISPTYDEIAETLRVGKSAARVLVNKLCSKGCIERAPGRFRNLMLTPAGLLCTEIAQQARKGPKSAVGTKETACG